MDRVVLKMISDMEYAIWVDDGNIGSIRISHNPLHQKNAYLTLSMVAFPHTLAGLIFTKLRETLKKPLQVMLSSNEGEQIRFLQAAGFVCKRRCFEMEVSKQEICVGVISAPLEHTARGTLPYQTCCRLLYQKYRTTHEAINPLTAEYAVFCHYLPDQLVYGRRQGEIAHYAFLEKNEIAYLDMLEPGTEDIFLSALMAELFDQYSMITFECDDNDDAAMRLKSFFTAQPKASYDTYLFV